LPCPSAVIRYNSQKDVDFPNSVKFLKMFVLGHDDKLHAERYGRFGGTVLQKQTLFLYPKHERNKYFTLKDNKDSIA
jgi:hypothetical protein